MQISQGSTYVGVFFNKVAGPQNSETLTQVFSCEVCQLSNNTYFVEDLWTAGSETPMHFFKNSQFTEHLQWLLRTVSGFQSATLLKRRLRQRYLSVSFAKFLRTSLDRNTCGWLLLVIICEFSEVFQMTSFKEHFWETAYFVYKLLNFNHQIQ